MNPTPLSGSTNGIASDDFPRIQTDSVAPLIFRSIQRDIQRTEQIVDGVANSHRLNAYTDGNGDIPNPGWYRGGGNLDPQFFKKSLGRIVTGIWSDQQKLLTAKPPKMVVITHAGFYKIRKPAEDFIANNMTVRVIDRFE